MVGQMKDRAKDRNAAALMGDLLVQLAQRENIKKMLSDMDEFAADDLIRELLDEFERIIDRRHLQTLMYGKETTINNSTLKPVPPPIALNLDQPPPTSSGLQVGSMPVKEPSISRLPLISRDVKGKGAEDARPEKWPGAMTGTGTGEKPPPASEFLAHAARIKKRISEIEETSSRQKRKSGVDAKADLHPDDDIAPGGMRERTDLESAGEQEDEQEEYALPIQKQHLPRIPYTFEDEDHVYLHGFTKIPAEDQAAPHPFMLEEKGIEGRDFAFGLDYHGLRFYLSKIHGSLRNVSKTGMLLLNKQESIRMRGTHEGILNDLRAHGVLLPFEFGTVARGKDELLAKIDKNIDELKDALGDLLATTWWNLSVYALDSRMAQLVGEEGLARKSEHERDRHSFSATIQTRKHDIKLLDKILGKQTKIAESVHEDLKAVAERCDIDMIVSLGSGSSEDWKLILKASYEVPPANVSKFNRAVTDLQYRHFLFEIMLSLAGNQDQFSFHKK